MRNKKNGYLENIIFKLYNFLFLIQKAQTFSLPIIYFITYLKNSHSPQLLRSYIPRML